MSGTVRIRQLVKALPKHNYVMKHAMLASGYSPSYSNNPHLLKRSKGYNRLMTKEIDNLRNLRERAITALAGKDPAAEEYKTLVEAVEKYTKLIQLLEGKPTEITAETTRQMTTEELEAELARLEEDGETTERPQDTSPAGEVEEGAGTEEAN